MNVEIVTERMPLVEIYPDVAKALDKPDAEFVRKYYAGKAPELQKDERSLIAYVTTEDIDRDMEVILTRGIDLKHFKKNPVVLWGHDYDGLPVAKADWIKRGTTGDSNALIAKATFAEHALADEVWNLYKGGFLKAFSIGFIVTSYRAANKDEFGDKTESVRGVIEKCQLLEFSCVNVPANQAALVAAVAKSLIALSDDTQKQLGLEDHEAEEVAEDAADDVTGGVKADDDLICKMEAVIDELGLATDAIMSVARDFHKVYLPKSEPVPTVEIVADDAKEVFACECIECGHKLDSEKHCKDIKCPKCGAQMRRAERPGPGQADASENVEQLIAEGVEKHMKTLTETIDAQLTQITGRVTPTG